MDYSFSFSYDEKEDKLYKVNEYTNIELIYEDEYNCLYHKLDGVYYTKLGSDKEEKLYRLQWGNWTYNLRRICKVSGKRNTLQ